MAVDKRMPSCATENRLDNTNDPSQLYKEMGWRKMIVQKMIKRLDQAVSDSSLMGVEACYPFVATAAVIYNQPS